MFIISTLIRLYQATLSPDHGVLRVFFPHGYCRFYPSCSAYADQAINTHGLYGVWLTALRLGKCHPWSAGGIDEIPKLKTQNCKANRQAFEFRMKF